MSSKGAYRKRERGRKLRYDHFGKDNELVLIQLRDGLYARAPYKSSQKRKLKDPIEPKKLALNIALLKTAKELVRLYGKEGDCVDSGTSGDYWKHYVTHRYIMNRRVDTEFERRYHRFSLIHIDSFWSEGVCDENFNFSSSLLLDCDIKHDILHYNTSTAWNSPNIFDPTKDDTTHAMFALEAMNMIKKYSAQAEKKITTFLKG